MTVFYRGPHAVVTHLVIRVPRTEWQSIPISELSAVHVVRTGPDGRLLQHRLLAASALASLFLTVPVAGRASEALAGLVIVASVVGAGACMRVRNGYRYDIVALHRAAVVVVFSSADLTEFDAVCRGLQRALELRDTV
jgi:hypothetical protein